MEVSFFAVRASEGVRLGRSCSAAPCNGHAVGVQGSFDILPGLIREGRFDLGGKVFGCSGWCQVGATIGRAVKPPLRGAWPITGTDQLQVVSGASVMVPLP